jgi:predicted nuclease of predicted toxin-antitoxin system
LKLLLDERVDRRLARDLAPHEVKTAVQMGWSGKKNGELLRLAEKEFEVFVTVDQNLTSQQNLPQFNIAVLVLRAPSSRLQELRALVPKILAALPTLARGRAETLKG